MKNHALSAEERKQFIMKYKIEDNQIIVFLANKKTYTVPFNEQNEKTIIEKLEKQAIYAQENNLRSVRSELKTSIFYSIFYFAIAATVGYRCADVLEIIQFLILLAAGIVFYPLQTIHNKNLEKDILKMKLFLENKEKLNSNVRKTQDNLLNVSDKAIQQIEQTPIDRPIFDINVIENYSLRDLKKIKLNIEKNIALGKIETLPKKEEASKILIVRR